MQFAFTLKRKRHGDYSRTFLTTDDNFDVELSTVARFESVAMERWAIITGVSQLLPRQSHTCVIEFRFDNQNREESRRASVARCEPGGPDPA